MDHRLILAAILSAIIGCTKTVYVDRPVYVDRAVPVECPVDPVDRPGLSIGGIDDSTPPDEVARRYETSIVELKRAFLAQEAQLKALKEREANAPVPLPVQ